MTDPNHLSIPKEVRDERHVKLNRALREAFALLDRGLDIPEFRRPGPYALRLLNFPGPGKELLVVPLLLGQGSIHVGPIDCDIGFDEEWMYEEMADAVAAACVWYLDQDNRAEPGGWIRHKGAKGVIRRRRYNDAGEFEEFKETEE